MSGSTSGMMQGIRYTSTAPLHSNATDLRNSGFYPNIGRLMGQCVWYAKNRAQEILYYSNMPDDLKQRAISSICKINRCESTTCWGDCVMVWWIKCL